MNQNHSLLFWAVAISIIFTYCYGQQPSNDVCEDATSISTLPFSAEGSVVNATNDKWSTNDACGFQQVSPGKGVWYKVERIEAGKRVKVTCSGMDAMLLSGQDSSTGDECGSPFACANAMVGRDNTDAADAISYEWTIMEGEVYFLYVASTVSFRGPTFNLDIKEVLPTLPPTEAPTKKPVASAASSSSGIMLLYILLSSLFLWGCLD